jgi:hypothetical protein
MKNIVWLVSYPKSGNTWFRMFLANYLRKSTDPLPLNEIESTRIASNAEDFENYINLNPFELTPDEVDLFRPDMYLTLSAEAKESEKILLKKVHDAYTINANEYPIFPEDVSQCAIYFVRNPLDVCVSYANHSTDNIESKVEFILDEEASIAGKKNGQLRQILLSWKSHINSWKNQNRIRTHFVRYEDMLQKPMETFGGIVHYLGLDYDQENLERSILFSNFKLLQQMEQEKGFREKAQVCNNFFWKGKIGNYKEYLTEEQVEKIVIYNSQTMKEFGYIDKKGNLTV